MEGKIVENLDRCPICGKTVKKIFMVYGTLEPFTAIDPLEGLQAYAPYSVEKELLHETKGNPNIVHIKFLDGEERLIIHIK